MTTTPSLPNTQSIKLRHSRANRPMQLDVIIRFLLFWKRVRAIWGILSRMVILLFHPKG